MNSDLYKLSYFLYKKGHISESLEVNSLIKSANPNASYEDLWNSLKRAEILLRKDFKLPAASTTWSPELENSFKLWVGTVAPSIDINSLYRDQNGDGNVTIDVSKVNSSLRQGSTQRRYVTVEKVTRNYIQQLRANTTAPQTQNSGASGTTRRIPPPPNSASGRSPSNQAGVISQRDLQQSGNSIGIPFRREYKKNQRDRRKSLGWFVYMSHPSGGKLLGPYNNKQEAEQAFKQKDPTTYAKKQKFDEIMKRHERGEYDQGYFLSKDPAIADQQAQQAAQFGGRHGHDELAGEYGHQTDLSYTEYLKNKSNQTNNPLPTPAGASGADRE